MSKEHPGHSTSDKNLAKPAKRNVKFEQQDAASHDYDTQTGRDKHPVSPKAPKPLKKPKP